MSSSEAFIAKYLSQQQQLELINDLIDNNDFVKLSELFVALKDLLILSDIDEAIIKLYSKIEPIIIEVLSNSEIDDESLNIEVNIMQGETMENIVQLINTLPSLQCKVQNWILVKLKEYIRHFKTRLFNPEFYDNFVNNSIKNFEDSSSQTYSAVALLNLLECIQTSSNDTENHETSEINTIIVILLGSDINNIASAAEKNLRWRIQYIVQQCLSSDSFDKFIWVLIQSLYQDGKSSEWKIYNALTFQLRFISAGKISDHLKLILKIDSFWENIQSALNSDIHLYRKLGLSVLQSTIKVISLSIEKIDTKLFHWDMNQKNEIIESWKKFTTLYEIITLDTSLNQLEEASSEVIEIFKNEYIYPSWSMLLFSTGLNASMESVRKYVLSLVFKVQNKEIFLSNTDILKDTILPTIAQAQFYITDGVTCKYGDTVSSFVSDLILTGSNTAEDILKVILEMIIERNSSFDASRVYISFGILSAFKSKKLRILSSTHLVLLRKIFEFEAEDEITETTLQKIYLKCLLYISKTVSVTEWIHTLANEITCRGSYRYISSLFEDLRDFAVINFEFDKSRDLLEPLLGTSVTFDLLAAILFSVEVQPTKSFLLEIAKSEEVLDNYTQDINDLLLKLLNEDLEDEEYILMDQLCKYKGFSTITWTSVSAKHVFQQLNSKFTGNKFIFFVSIFEYTANYNMEADEINFNDIIQLYNTIKLHVQQFSQDEFKFKDKIYANYFQLVQTYLKSNAIEIKIGDGELSHLIEIMRSNCTTDSGNYLSDFSIGMLIEYILNTFFTETVENGDIENAYVLNLFDILVLLWENIASERLVLKQRAFHLCLIKSIFNPIIMLHAAKKNNSIYLMLKDIGCNIIAQAHARRGFLPSISKCFSDFIPKFSKLLSKDNSEYEWIGKLLRKAFTLQLANSNVFQIKSTIATLFDNNLTSYVASSPYGIYFDVYGAEESSSRVYIIDTIISSPSFFKEHFVYAALTETSALTPVKRTDGVEEVQRLLLWQLIVACAPKLDAEILIHYSSKYILDSLFLESSPLVRIYKEWYLAFEIAHSIESGSISNSCDFLFSQLDDHSRPMLVVSAEKILFIVLKYLAENGIEHQAILERFIGILIANASSNKPHVRHFSNSLMISFWPVFEESISDKTLRLVLHNLYDNAKMSELTGQYRTGDANIWDLKADYTFTNVFGIILKRTTDHDVPYICESTFTKYMQHLDDSLIGSDNEDSWLSKRDPSNNNREIKVIDQKGSQLQTKSGAWETVVDINATENEEKVKRSDLIVVSSLVDKPPNLGGICRLCDVLGVGLLTVQDLRVKNHPQFKNVAVTADKWMPMVEVPIDNIIKFMQEKKKEGYTLIGLEQTDKSIELNQYYKFPKKSLILLGTEAHGIPGYLLSELDLCLEIQQHGVIRSMNIQTATAVICYSYTVQHM
ncbi:hypothetical protein TPHA_0C03590 [Tetrapisispora phaffii CBS 4417]|uniref:tRNA/rRNA methyltransferase SpoU type domain-containing protein n=1 Tax=Tetrapisispora phaffii (strain ATCC 24235 / CBS 4417 / NBRC 1672 / NRRL Y-8282 / UCD 70-5) TaxID=1071381 RepID=G8BQJ9_TETPH|nr:hypothetical protein TPHA_0C03590 [Tetrapisispora phaffii CBS 4417]CCE62511.1 hypothetical protein TPHA_0C03590 [Tetrapisispora phaffii CBS 4417]